MNLREGAEGRRARDLLIEEHLPLVGYNVNEMAGRLPAHVSRAELASAGALALVKAAHSFDHSKGVPFSRYASLRIKGALIDELRGMDWVPRGARRRSRDVSDVVDTLTGQLGRTPSTGEVARTMGMSEAEVASARVDHQTRVLSIDAYEGAMADMVTDAAIGPLDALLGGELLEYLSTAVAALPEKLQIVIEELFIKERPVAELAQEMGVTRSRVSQLRTEALALLKEGLEANLDATSAPEVDRTAGVATRRRQRYQVSIAASMSAARGAAAVAPAIDALAFASKATRAG